MSIPALTLTVAALDGSRVGGPGRRGWPV